MAIGSIEKSSAAKTAARVDNDVYVEFTRVEVPMSVKEALFKEHIRICPKNAELTDEEIQEMVNEVRYGHKHGKR